MTGHGTCGYCDNEVPFGEDFCCSGCEAADEQRERAEQAEGRLAAPGVPTLRGAARMSRPREARP